METLTVKWRSHIRNMFDEILGYNNKMYPFDKPFRITMSILGAAAKHAAEIGDEKMIGYFCRLSLYTFSDPASKDYDKERTDYYINKTV